MDRVKNDLKRTDQTVVKEEADDRDRWRVLVENKRVFYGRGAITKCRLISTGFQDERRG